jgi:hypothetical protein
MRVARRELMSVNVWQHCDAVKTKIVISAALALAAEFGLQRRLSRLGALAADSRLRTWEETISMINRLLRWG